MTRLRWRFLLPPVVLAGIAVTGVVAGQPLVGVLLGTLLGLLVAWWAGYEAQTRIDSIRSLLSVPPAPDLQDQQTPSIFNDEIDQLVGEAREFVRQEEQRRSAEVDELVRQGRLLDMMNDGVLRVDGEGLVTYANVAAGALFGGRNPTNRSFISVTHDHELQRLLEDCLDTGDDQHHTFEIAGEQRLIAAAVMRVATDPAEALVVLRDVTELARLQTMRRDFVANVSHELRTPLTTIKILTETLMDLNDEEPTQAQFLTKIDHEVDHMTDLVNDLIDLARLQAHDAPLTLRQVEIRKLVSSVCERMAPIAERQSIELTSHVEAANDTINGDERRLTQALVNLVHNAIIHTPAGGSVGVIVRERGDQLDFLVRDTGSGIAPPDLARIWERFYKADRSRSKPGTGLGLAVVKYIALAHGGDVGVISQVGEGSEFRISIPRWPQTSRRGSVLNPVAD
jgi:two-component system phosphate regulon sensor histidine kinase PhoR